MLKAFFHSMKLKIRSKRAAEPMESMLYDHKKEGTALFAEA